MKKIKKLSLNKETIVELSSDQMTRIVGGYSSVACLALSIDIYESTPACCPPKPYQPENYTSGPVTNHTTPAGGCCDRGCCETVYC